MEENVQYKIITEKGNITLRLLIDDAPDSVENFIDLVNGKFYNDIAFHRVVPNFVVQGGCYRGDGWGGEDFFIRSELADLKYGEGTLGMASTGKDTEGTQWFITHAPTPPLDGKYSIFGRVTKGMETVHKLEVGDRIIDIKKVANE